MNPLEKAEKATELQLSMLAEKQPPLSPLIQETFETIFKEFAQRALKSSDEAACPLIDRLIRIATILDPALRQNQSFFVEKGATVMNQDMDEKQKADCKCALESRTERAEFERVCRPVVEFIQKNYCTPLVRVLIDWNSAELIQTQKREDFKMWIDEEQSYRYKIPAAEVLAERLLRY